MSTRDRLQRLLQRLTDRPAPVSPQARGRAYAAREGSQAGRGENPPNWWLPGSEYDYSGWSDRRRRPKRGNRRNG